MPSRYGAKDEPHTQGRYEKSAKDVYVNITLDLMDTDVFMKIKHAGHSRRWDTLPQKLAKILRTYRIVLKTCQLRC